MHGKKASMSPKRYIGAAARRVRSRNQERTLKHVQTIAKEDSGGKRWEIVVVEKGIFFFLLPGKRREEEKERVKNAISRFP